MNGAFYELAMWQQKWCMDNLSPLPFTIWVSPHYDPYEIDPSHYNDSTNNQPTITYSDEYEYEYEYEQHHETHYDTESDDDFYENT